MREDRGFSWLYLMGRLAPGASAEQVRSELASVLVDNRSSAPAAETAARLSVAAGARGVSNIRERFADPLRVLMALAAIVLLIACTNLAGLLLTRGTARRWEIAMRLAIGASRARVVRQLLTESLLLAGAGGAVGLVFAAWGSAALLALPLGERTVMLDVAPSLRMLAFTGAVALVAGLLFGLAPAWRATRGGALQRSSHLAGRERAWGLRGSLIAVQVALSLVLLAGGVMFVRTLRNLETQDLGFQADRVLVVPVAIEQGYQPVWPLLIPELLNRISAVNGVTSATAALGGTLDNIGGARIQVEGSTTRDRVAADWVGPAYIRTAGMTLLSGRDFTFADDERAPRVVVVNQTMARKYFGDGDALGRHLTFNKNQFEIAGVVKDAKYADLRESTPPFVYFPTMQTQSGLNNLEIRTASADSIALMPTIRSVIQEVDPHVSAGAAMTLSERIDRKLGRERLVADLAGFFGMLTLALLSIGVYGTLAYGVAQRTKEIGVRLALGANGLAIVWMVVRQIVSVVSAGAIAGIAGALLVGRLVKPLLFGLAPADPSTLGGALALLLVIAALAGGLPARAAARLDPATVLRE
jgi:predicted permease